MQKKIAALPKDQVKEAAAKAGRRAKAEDGLHEEGAVHADLDIDHAAPDARICRAATGSTIPARSCSPRCLPPCRS